MAWWQLGKRSEEDAYRPVHLVFSIRKKLLAGFTAVLLLLVVVALTNVYQIEVSRRYSDQVTNLNIPATLASMELSKEVYASILNLNGWIITKNKKFQDNFNNTWVNIRSLVFRNDEYSHQWKNQDDVRLWLKIQSDLVALHEVQMEMLRNSEDPEKNKQMMAQQILPLSNQILADLGSAYSYGPRGANQGLVFKLKQNLENNTIKFISDIRILQINQWAMLGAGIFLAILIASITARSICRPLYSAIHIARELAAGRRDLSIVANRRDETGELLNALGEMQTSIRHAEKKLIDSEARVQQLLSDLQSRVVEYRDLIEKVADGDLRQHLVIEGNDDLSKLGRHLNEMTDGLSNITAEIAGAIHKMGGNLDQVEEAVNAQAASAAEQAAAVTQTVTIIEQIKATSSQTLEKANSLAELADRTREQSKKGLDAVEKTTTGMQDIQSKVKAIANSILALTEQTKKIGETTAAVNSLAERSKLLALNASIEAAKAGEAGKGFGVVATEIKDLAEQSQQATAQVQEILGEIQQATERAALATEEGGKGVNEGLHLIDQTGQVIHHLSEVIHESSRSNHQIVAAVKQEAAGIEQIAQAMAEINTATDQFVTFTNQTSSVANQLAEITVKLKDSIKRYKISNRFHQREDD